jgi:hypothetical protein
LNNRSPLKISDCKINENGTPCSPKDENLPMKYECISTLKMKFPDINLFACN